MKQIKTAGECYDEHISSPPFNDSPKDAAIRASKIYAEQFIDTAAEEILVDDSEDTNRKIILKLKEHLK